MADGSYTLTEASDFMLATFLTRWDHAALGWDGITALAAEPPVYWDNVAPASAPKEPDPARPYLEAKVRHVAGADAAIGGRLQQQAGFVRIDISTPLDTGVTLNRQIGDVVASAFRGRAGDGDGCGIWFRDVTYRELGADDRSFKAYVIANFRYKSAGGIEAA